jgi:hypothetical protein
MRVEDEASAVIDMADGQWHLVVAAPRADGAVPAHLVSSHPFGAACLVLLDLTGRILEATAVDDDDAPAVAVLRALPAVDSTVLRAGLSHGLRRRLSLFEPLGTDTSTAEQAHQALLLRTRVMLAAVECDDPKLRPILADLAPSWTGTVDDLKSAGRAALGA